MGYHLLPIKQVDELGDGEGEDGQRELILTGGAKNAILAVQRYYSNNVTDISRQTAMDLFLGVLIPQGDKPGVWEQVITPAEQGGPGNENELVLGDKTIEQVMRVSGILFRITDPLLHLFHEIDLFLTLSIHG